MCAVLEATISNSFLINALCLPDKQNHRLLKNLEDDFFHLYHLTVEGDKL